jgi:hypothetical protein
MFYTNVCSTRIIKCIIGVDPWTMVIADEHLPHNSLSGCLACSQQETISLLQELITLMSYSTYHQRSYIMINVFTLPASTISLILQAFPNTPWVFIFRDPIVATTSHVDKLHQGGISRVDASNDQVTAWMRHLETIFDTVTSLHTNKSLFIDEKSLPNSIIHLIFPHFQVIPTDEVILKILLQSNLYKILLLTSLSKIPGTKYVSIMRMMESFKVINV